MKETKAKRDHPVFDTEDSNYVESGGKRQREISNKICGVYTPDARLKRLFESMQKVENRPIVKTNRAIFTKFSDVMRENPAQTFEIQTGHVVTNSFFVDIAQPGNGCLTRYYLNLGDHIFVFHLLPR